ncbi:hypothetical protein FW774_01125 (plasmid) [Pedobacter sp. BS3]|uniref:hypothetical protein n=1 Tax=Pedobacter sp. BS3 TaxID=2567937 RepID=UPI0011EF14CF|nr:hypothetical protein [Pedobacter sp. BS3]TZF85708.1 hypothetical protein FW774_01125 [Pedobacter sp. BS3]
MKNVFFILFAITLINIICFTGCKKKEHSPLNMTLYDKPLSVIQAAIHGKWKLQYGKGGINAKMVQYYNNSYYDFSTQNTVRVTYNDVIYADTTIIWRNEAEIYTNGLSTFTMNFYDKRGYPYIHIVDRFINDTLVLHDYAVDAVYYYFTKVKN